MSWGMVPARGTCQPASLLADRIACRAAAAPPESRFWLRSTSVAFREPKLGGSLPVQAHASRLLALG